MIGAGGVGKAVGFGLVALGLEEIRLVERDLPQAEAVGAALRAARPGLPVTMTGDPVAGARGAAGVISCTPVGMVGYYGTLLLRAQMAGALGLRRRLHARRHLVPLQSRGRGPDYH